MLIDVNGFFFKYHKKHLERGLRKFYNGSNIIFEDLKVGDYIFLSLSYSLLEWDLYSDGSAGIARL